MPEHRTPAAQPVPAEDPDPGAGSSPAAPPPFAPRKTVFGTAGPPWGQPTARPTPGAAMPPETVLLDRPAPGAPAPAPAAPEGTAGPLLGPAAAPALHVMSYNIRFHHRATAPGDPDHWPARAPLLARLLRQEQPTLLGVQEALFHQLPVLRRALPEGYDMIGYGRAGGSKGEYSPVLYDARRLELAEWDQFWLSDTPELIGSATWGNDVPRIVVWGRFLDRATGAELVLVNTHLDHHSEPARDAAAAAVAELVTGFPPGTPVLVTGDFNAVAGASGPWAQLVDSGLLVDTWAAARQRLTPAWGTFPGYLDPVEDGPRIDWVLAGPGVQVLAGAVNPARFGGRWPSDHAPVQALVRLDPA
ncbi:endonuclease/exonuclease/phosphatase family protein [Kocuria sp. LUK]|uniref:endonuclease/exonuclease/phosphatase family protein n=1 Tax=Kocuria sp. LUK TaxID=2897828 RepID=UPI00272E0497|nr:endonuclease/exonuclease/phosphatase family protein [Kocuria sp. LUK]